MKFLVGIFNSRLIEMYLREHTKKMGQCFEYSSNVLSEIPIAKITSNNTRQYENIIEIVEKILLLTKKEINTDFVKSQTSQFQKEIDQLVYQLYELKEEEIAIVENLT
jgi:enoyl-[acyl-carrier-protein] reductase (NADH)